MTYWFQYIIRKRGHTLTSFLLREKRDNENESEDERKRGYNTD